MLRRHVHTHTLKSVCTKVEHTTGLLDACLTLDHVLGAGPAGLQKILFLQAALHAAGHPRGPVHPQRWTADAAEPRHR